MIVCTIDKDIIRYPKCEKKARARIGEVWGWLTIIDIKWNEKSERWDYVCLCKCGKTIKPIKYINLTSGKTKSCGCLKKEQSKKLAESRIGEVWGYLTIMTPVWNERQYFFTCLCKCGNTTNPIPYGCLVSGRTKSCGCFLVETCKRNCKNGKNRKFYYLSNDVYLKLASSYEIMYTMILDKQNINWKYEPKLFQLSNNTRYTPDFYLPDTNEIIEVKGHLNKKAKIKYDLFHMEYPKYKYKLVFQKELEDQLGIKCDKFLTYYDKYIEEPLKHIEHIADQQRYNDTVMDIVTKGYKQLWDVIYEQKS